jgi:hypothetical protein
MGGEIFNGHFFYDESGQGYLAMGKGVASVFEIEGLHRRVNTVRRIACDREVNIASHQIAVADRNAVEARTEVHVENPSGPGKRTPSTAPGPIAVFAPVKKSPALDGSMNGWESSVSNNFGLDREHFVRVRLMYDQDNVYLRWHLRQSTPIFIAAAKPYERIFTHDRAATTLSFYINGRSDRGVLNPRVNTSGSQGDTRVVFAIAKDDGRVVPIALGMYPIYPDSSDRQPVEYRSPVGEAGFENVALLKSAALSYVMDSDNRGFILSAKIPRSALHLMPPLNSHVGARTNFSATIQGNCTFWWSNIDGSASTNTSDEPSEAKLYPGSWSYAKFL